MRDEENTENAETTFLLYCDHKKTTKKIVSGQLNIASAAGFDENTRTTGTAVKTISKQNQTKRKKHKKQHTK